MGSSAIGEVRHGGPTIELHPMMDVNMRKLQEHLEEGRNFECKDKVEFKTHGLILYKTWKESVINNFTGMIWSCVKELL